MNQHLKDLNNEEEIVVLVNAFYAKVQKDETIGHIFSDVAHVDWEKHLPRMYQFWGSVLLGSAEYTGNPMQKHIALSQHFPLEHHHFNAWLALWNETIDDLFTGPKAENAKVRAQSIAEIMRFKVGAK